MAKARWPEAEWLGNGKSGGTYTAGPFRVVMHTTETGGLPGYRLGRSAPHLTYTPRQHRWVQHTVLTTAARALRNPSGGVQTNRRSALQVEVVCYSNKTIADRRASRLWVGDLTTRHLTDLASFLQFANTEFAVDLRYDPKPFNDARCSGTGSPCRMTRGEWRLYDAVTDHARVPENGHWDCGALDFDTLIQIANGGAPPPPEGDDMYKSVKQGDGIGTTGGDPAVKEWQEVLNLLGAGLNPDGKYGGNTGAAVDLNSSGNGSKIGPTEGAEIIAATDSGGPPSDHTHPYAGDTGGVS